MFARARLPNVSWLISEGARMRSTGKLPSSEATRMLVGCQQELVETPAPRAGTDLIGAHVLSTGIPPPRSSSSKKAGRDPPRAPAVWAFCRLETANEVAHSFRQSLPRQRARSRGVAL